MAKKRNKKVMRLQQAAFTRFFVTIPYRFIKELRWVKGESLEVKLEGDKLQIKKKKW